MRIHTVVVKELLNKIDVSENHPSAAVALELELGQSFTFGSTIEKKC